MEKQKSVWVEGIKIWPMVFKRAWPWLIFTSVISIGLDAWVEVVRKMDDKLALIIGLMSLIISLFLEAFSTIIISQIVLDARDKTKRSLAGAIETNIKPVFIETTRALVPILLKFLLLIIPGIIEVVRLFFVAYVVQFDQGYKEGKVDALDRSRELVKGRFWWVTFVLLSTVVITLVPSLWRGHFSFMDQMGMYIFALLVGMGAEAYADAVIYLTYENLVNSKRLAFVPDVG